MPVWARGGVASYAHLTQGVIFTFEGIARAGRAGPNPPSAPRVAAGSRMKTFVRADA